MAYCGPRGIPLSTFLAWDDESQDAALTWARHEAMRCPSCGAHPDEPQHHHVEVCRSCRDRDVAQHEASERPGARVVPFVGEVDVKGCEACAARHERHMEAAQQRMQDKREEASRGR